MHHYTVRVERTLRGFFVVGVFIVGFFVRGFRGFLAGAGPGSHPLDAAGVSDVGATAGSGELVDTSGSSTIVTAPVPIIGNTGGSVGSGGGVNVKTDRHTVCAHADTRNVCR